jgi:hypothetical protein
MPARIVLKAVINLVRRRIAKDIARICRRSAEAAEANDQKDPKLAITSECTGENL